MVRYVPYQAKKVVNVYRHIDGWFWNKYSAHPYVGCQYGCEYCYWRDEKYNMLAREKGAQGLDDPFSQYIKVKVNAAELLKRELSRLQKDIIVTGDYQPAEVKFKLSRDMLEVCLELGFPVLINEKSPLVLRDLDLIKKINNKSWACILWSIAHHSSKGYREIFEPNAPTIESRFEAMGRISREGILTGTAFMPILPFICDHDENLEAVVEKTAENGGKFVLAGSLTMSGAQATRYTQTLRKYYPDLVEKYKQIYDNGYSPKQEYFGPVGRRVKKFCEKYGIKDRMPRHIQPGRLAANKKIAEILFNETYHMEIEGAEEYKIWAYRKAAWAIDELDEDVKAVYERSGVDGLRAIPGIGKKLSKRIAKEL